MRNDRICGNCNDTVFDKYELAEPLEPYEPRPPTVLYRCKGCAIAYDAAEFNALEAPQ